MKPKMILGQPSWRVASATVEAFLTEQGGHLGPVTFRVGGRRIRPYSVAPWAEEKLDASVPLLLRILRGDFFCLPFGGNATPYRGEAHPLHGETATARWKLESVEPGRLHASLRTKVRRGRVDKFVVLPKGQPVIYQQHVISGMTGPMSCGHHAMVHFASPGRVSTSRFVHGETCPQQIEQPEARGYTSLQVGAKFRSLERVPMINGKTTDLSRYPSRRGYEDIATVVADASRPFAWTAVTFPQERYVWFALKDPRVLRSTVFWISNGGRHYAPWDGRHIDVMGLEEITGYFAMGLAESARANPFRKKGYATAIQLNPKQPFVVNYIMAVATIPAGFDMVKSITPTKGGVALRSASGKTVRAKVDVRWLRAVAQG